MTPQGTLRTRVSAEQSLLSGSPTTPEATRALHPVWGAGRDMHEKINCSCRANKQPCTKPTSARACRDRLLQGCRGGRAGEPAAGAQHPPAKRWRPGSERNPESAASQLRVEL